MFANLPAPGRAQLVRFELDKPLLLQPGSYWLRLESRDGAAVWFVDSKPGVSVRAWEKDNSDGDAIADLAGVANWIAADGPAAAAQRFPEITLAGQPLSVSRDGADWVYDLTPALQLNETFGNGLLTKDLSMVASRSKPVTVYPPRIEYEI